MARLVLVLLVLLAIFWALRSMSLSWRRRIQAGEHIPPLPAAPEQFTADALRIEFATYLGTVTDKHWLDRVAAQGLGHRGPTSLIADDSGVVLNRVGAPAVFIPSRRIKTVAPAKGHAGRVYGRDGVISVEWVWGDDLLITGIRVPDAGLRKQLLEVLKRASNGNPKPPTATNSTTSESATTATQGEK